MNLKAMLKSKRGVAGLEMLKSGLMQIIIIGLMIFLFVYAGATIISNVDDGSATGNQSVNVINETITVVGDTVEWFPIIIIFIIIVVLMILLAIVNKVTQGTGGGSA